MGVRGGFRGEMEGNRCCASVRERGFAVGLTGVGEARGSQRQGGRTSDPGRTSRFAEGERAGWPLVSGFGLGLS